MKRGGRRVERTGSQIRNLRGGRMPLADFRFEREKGGYVRMGFEISEGNGADVRSGLAPGVRWH